MFKKKKNNDVPVNKKKNKKEIDPHFKFLAHEDDEDSNPQIHLYDEIVRAAMAYSTEPISCNGISKEDVAIIFNYVICDYPEIFWLDTVSYSYQSNGMVNSVVLIYRCLDANGKLDVKEVNRKRNELRKASKEFVRGISKKTDPYDAFITIYRRLILKLDYDGIGLAYENENDKSQEDSLRSLYSALVKHKVVCAGYARALEFLLHMVGIPCGMVCSEPSTSNSSHAFNIVKLGLRCYYVDATWGDRSNTKQKGESKEIYNDFIGYDYCLVCEDEFQFVSKGSEPYHKAQKNLYPGLEKLKATNHEYYRYHDYYLCNYNEEKLAEIFSKTANTYNAKEMGKFVISFRCSDYRIAEMVYKRFTTSDVYNTIVRKAKAMCNRKSKDLFKLKFAGFTKTDANIIYCIYQTAKEEKNK